MTDAHDSYLQALAAIRLRTLIRGERWPEPEDTFDLVLAAALSPRPIANAQAARAQMAAHTRRS